MIEGRRDDGTLDPPLEQRGRPDRRHHERRADRRPRRGEAHLHARPAAAAADLVTGEPVEKAHYERSDISVVPAAGVMGEAMVMLTLARFVLEKTGGDSMAEVADNLAPLSRADRATAGGAGAARRRAVRGDRGGRGAGRRGRGRLGGDD